jgi:hypothetical protein
MKIFFSSVSGSDKTESIHYFRVLQRLGHQVLKFSVPASMRDPERGLWVEAGFSPEVSLEALIDYSGFTPDLFLYIEPNGLIPRGMEHAPFPTACILCDTHRSLDARLRIAEFFDHVFLYHRNYVHYFNAHPPEHVHWLPYGVDIEMFRPTGGERDLDIAFVGNLDLNTERKQVFFSLAEKYKMNERRFYLQREIPAIYSRAKIVINLPLADDLNFRTFEAMSCGAMLLTRRVSNGQEVLFQEGKHFEAFSDEQELYQKVEYYLSNPGEREVIAAAGLAEIKERHRLEQRLGNLLAIVKGKADKIAPIRRKAKEQIDRQYAWLYEYWRMVGPGFNLLHQARMAKRRWLPLLLPAIRSILRVVFR